MNLFELTFILVLLAIHFVADFMLQPQAVAIKKSHSILALLTHVRSYTFSTGIMLLIYVWLVPSLRSQLTLISIFQYVVLVGLSHCLVDMFTSKVSKYFYNKNDLHNFFVIIGLDQFLHQATIILFYYITIQQ